MEWSSSNCRKERLITFVGVSGPSKRVLTPESTARCGHVRLLVPGSYFLFPLLAWWLDQRRQKRPGEARQELETIGQLPKGKEWYPAFRTWLVRQVTEVLMNLRQYLRLPVQFRSLLSNPGHPDAVGTVTDLSLGGCLIGSPSPVSIGMRMKLLVEVPGEESPICVEEAAVRWVRGQQCGLQFVTFAKPEYERLRRVVQALE